MTSPARSSAPTRLLFWSCILFAAAASQRACARPSAHDLSYMKPAVLNCRQILKGGIGEDAKVVENRNPRFKIAVLKEKDTVSESLAASGIWEEPADFLRRSTAQISRIPRCAGKRNFIDVGANIGTFTLTAATLNYSVAAFEPFLKNVRLLKYSICLNGLQDRIKLFTVALGEREHTCRLYSYDVNQGNGVVDCKEQTRTTFTRDSEVGPLPLSLRQTVRVFPMDAFSKDLQTCSSMKIDVEGHEAKALLGGAHFFSSSKAPLRIRTEVNPPSLIDNGITKEGYYWLYHALGYRPLDADNIQVFPSEKYGDNEGALYDKEFVLARSS